MSGVSNEQYLGFEEGTTSLTLPEIELITILLGVDFSALTEDAPIVDDAQKLFRQDIQQKYKTLRDKMIRARLLCEKLSKGVTIDNIHAVTNISPDLLQAFESGETPIPLSDLVKICDFYSLPLESLVHQQPLTTDNVVPHSDQPRWQPEFPGDVSLEDDQSAESLDELIRTLRQLPVEAQARIAKILLDELKTS